jgi:hypothetical protein
VEHIFVDRVATSADLINGSWCGTDLSSHNKMTQQIIANSADDGCSQKLDYVSEEMFGS